MHLYLLIILYFAGSFIILLMCIGRLTLWLVTKKPWRAYFRPPPPLHPLNDVVEVRRPAPTRLIARMRMLQDEMLELHQLHYNAANRVQPPESSSSEDNVSFKFLILFKKEWGAKM